MTEKFDTPPKYNTFANALNFFIMTLVGQKAPCFRAPAVINGSQITENFTIADYIGKQAVVLFFYPKDFTFICPTELYGLQQKMPSFTERNVALVGCSTDTVETHWAWLQTDRQRGGIKGVTYPLVADESKTITCNYGVLGGEWYTDENNFLQFRGNPVAQRAIFLIDSTGVIRHMLINDLSLGRNIHEILRVIDMMHHVEKHGEVCPANWEKGEKAFKATTEDLINYLAKEQATCCRGHKEPNGSCK